MLLSMGTHNEFFRMNNDAEIHRRELREINIKIKKKTNFESIRDKKRREASTFSWFNFIGTHEF